MTIEDKENNKKIPGTRIDRENDKKFDPDRLVAKIASQTKSQIKSAIRDNERKRNKTVATRVDDNKISESLTRAPLAFAEKTLSSLNTYAKLMQNQGNLVPALLQRVVSNDNRPKPTQTKTLLLEDKRPKTLLLDDKSIERLANAVKPTDLISHLDTIAKEKTQSRVADEVKSLGDQLLEFANHKGIYQMTSPELIQELEQLRTDTSTGLVAVERKVDDVYKNTSILEKIKKGIVELTSTVTFLWEIMKPFNVIQREIHDTLSADAKVQSDWYKFDREDRSRATLSQNILSTRHEAMDSSSNPFEETYFEKKWGELRGMINDFAEIVVPPESVRQKAIDGIKGTATMFGVLGGVLGQTMSNILTPLLTRAVGMLGVGGAIIDGITAIAGFLAGSATIMGSVVAVLVGSAIYNVIKHPEQLTNYATAFTTLWTDGISPLLHSLVGVFTGLWDALSPVVGAFEQWWNSGGSSVIDNIGAAVNNTLIYIFGTAIPALFGGLADITNNATKLVSDIITDLLGVFGIGPKGSEGLMFILNDMVNSIAQYVIDSTLTIGETVSKILSLDKIWQSFEQWWTGLTDSVHQKLVDMWNGFDSAWNNLVVTVNKFVANGFSNLISVAETAWNNVNPINKIQQWLSDIADFIFGLFPSIEDIKTFMLDSIRSIPGGDTIANWLTKKLTTVPEQEKTAKSSYNKFIESDVGHQNRTAVVIQQNSSPTNTFNNMVNSMGGGSGGGVPNTKPEISDWDRKVNSFPVAR